MRALIPALMVLFAVVGHGEDAISAVDRRIPAADRRKYYGDSFIYRGAPFCCIYVGLNTNETALFDTNFWRFANQHDIRKPEKDYMVYSGPPLVTCKNEHVSVFVDSSEKTTNIVKSFEKSRRFQENGGPVDWQFGMFWNAYWPTNACRITKDGKEVLAPITGTVKLAPNDTNYPLQDFKRLCEALTVTLQSAFPDRAVRGFSYDGDPK